MSYIDFSIINVKETCLPEGFDKNAEDLKLLIILQEDDYQGRYVKSLSEVISAIKLDLDTEVAIVIIKAGEQISVSDLYSHVRYQNCLTFGIENISISLNIDPVNYRIRKFEHYSLLQVDSLHILMEDPTMKRNLWMNLKELFNI